MDKKIVVYIARDDSVIPEDLEHAIERHPEREVEFAKLHIFYDTPQLEYNPDWYNGKPRYEWKNARIIAEVPSYMFPDIKPKQMCVLTGSINIDNFENN